MPLTQRDDRIAIAEQCPGAVGHIRGPSPSDDQLSHEARKNPRLRRIRSDKGTLIPRHERHLWKKLLTEGGEKCDHRVKFVHKPDIHEKHCIWSAVLEEGAKPT